MKRFFLILLFCTISNLVTAQDLVWETKILNAIERSNTEKKPIFLFFTGSDWCGWCIRLQNEVFKTPEFTAWAKDNVILVDLDFPRRTAQPEDVKAQNASLQQTFSVQGFPSIRIANAELKDGRINFDLLGGLGYAAGGPTVWLKSANEILQLNKKDYTKKVVVVLPEPAKNEKKKVSKKLKKM